MKNSNPQTFLQYTLTTDIYKADVSVHAPKALVPEIESAYKKVIAKDKKVVVKLLHLIEKYPNIPQFKNFLSLYYSLNKDNEKAREINDELLQQFPGYLYGKINLAQFYLASNKPEKVPEVLGANMELCDLYPERKIFHHDEFLNFYETAGHYYCNINELQKAEAILDNLNEAVKLLDIGRSFAKLKNQIFAARLQAIDFSKFSKKNPANEKDKPTLPQTIQPPLFHFSQINWLYQYGLGEIPAEKIYELLALEKEWLRTDLETAILDAVKRYNFFKQQDVTFNETDFCLHALYLLKEIKAEESLPALLELMRQPQDLLEFYMQDTLVDTLWQVIYTLGLNQANKLEAYLKEPLNHAFARSEVCVALKQIIFHHPEKREEIISLYKDLIHFFISNKEDKTITDDTVINLMVGNIIEFNGKELLPEIKKLYAENMKDELLNGTLQAVAEELDELAEGDFDEIYKQPIQNYFELAEEFAIVDDNVEYDDDEQDDSDIIYDDFEEIEEDATSYFYAGDKPYIQEAPKVGRNEHCPCGSGKKYKNCHGINE